MAELQRARLIPISGIGSEQEAETRATSALLAVLSIVRDFSDQLLTPLGASSAKKATVEAFTEVPYVLDGKSCRPDGLVRVTYGTKSWSTLVEVKTGEHPLDADQVNTYFDIARENGIDSVLTISNEIPPSPGTHPTAGLKMRSNSKVQIHHLSWTAILSAAVMTKVHRGVSDPEQAWILGELVRYLEHPKSGAMAFDDMGAEWVNIRNSAKESTLTARTEGLVDVVARWDQLLRFAALRLGSEVGIEVTPVLSKAQQDAKVRSQFLTDSMVNNGILSGVLRVPNTAGDLEITADLNARRLAAVVTFAAPEDRGAVGRITWLIAQLPDAHPHTMVESWAKNARSPMATASLGAIREDKAVLLDASKSEPVRFRVVTRGEMGQGRKTGGKSPGFIDSVLNLIDTHYATVVQTITPWQAKAPRVDRRASVDPGGDAESTGTPEHEPVTPQSPPPVPTDITPWSPLAPLMPFGEPEHGN